MGMQVRQRGTVHATSGRSTSRSELRLIEGFELEHQGRPIRVTPTLQRLIAYLALRGRPVLRAHLAGALWLDSTEEHAVGCLRSALCRLRQLGEGVIHGSTSHVWLSPEIVVDLWDARDLIRRLMDDDANLNPSAAGIEMLCGELLPDWYDDWVLVERERFRQMRLHGLESMCLRLTEQGMFARAVDAGLAAVAAEPLRESAQRVLIAAHVAEGNTVEGLRQFHRYCAMLRDELGLEPSPELSRLVAFVRAS